MKSLTEARSFVEDWLTAWFAQRSKLGKRTVESTVDLVHTNYFDAAWLSSMEVVEFVTEIEQYFDIQFSDRDLQDSRFVTIAGLAELIAELSAQNIGSC
jgi:acyl carrier protein